MSSAEDLLTEVRNLLPLLEDKAVSSFDKREAKRADAELQATREVKRYLASRRTQVDGTEERACEAHRARVSSL